METITRVRELGKSEPEVISEHVCAPPLLRLDEKDREILLAMQSKIDEMRHSFSFAAKEVPIKIEIDGIERIAKTMEEQTKIQKEMWDMVQKFMAIIMMVVMREISSKSTDEDKAIIDRLKADVLGGI